MRIFALALVALFMSPNAAAPAFAHCQIPCGIYDDERQFDAMIEHVRTIEKSMTEINELSAQATPNYHMISRWTFNKEEHAQKIQDIAHAYFLTQRVKVPAEGDKKAWEDYVTHTTLLHQILVAAMKTKQTTDLENVDKLESLIGKYKDHYFKDHKH